MNESAFRNLSLNGIAICLVCLMASCGGSTDAIELNGVVSPDGREFFFTRVIDDVFIMHRCRLGEDGGWSLASALAEPVNTADYRESYPTVVADGSLYFSSDRPGGQGKGDIWRAQRLADGGIGGGDLYVSFRRGDGTWSEPQLLPPTINSELLDYCPMGTPDGRYLFFSRPTGDSLDEADAGDVFWVDAAAIERMRP